MENSIESTSVEEANTTEALAQAQARIAELEQNLRIESSKKEEAVAQSKRRKARLDALLQTHTLQAHSEETRTSTNEGEEESLEQKVAQLETQVRTHAERALIAELSSQLSDAGIHAKGTALALLRNDHSLLRHEGDRVVIDMDALLEAHPVLRPTISNDTQALFTGSGSSSGTRDAFHDFLDGWLAKSEGSH